MNPHDALVKGAINTFFYIHSEDQDIVDESKVDLSSPEDREAEFCFVCLFNRICHFYSTALGLSTLAIKVISRPACALFDLEYLLENWRIGKIGQFVIRFYNL